MRSVDLSYTPSAGAEGALACASEASVQPKWRALKRRPRCRNALRLVSSPRPNPKLAPAVGGAAAGVAADGSEPAPAAPRGVVGCLPLMRARASTRNSDMQSGQNQSPGGTTSRAGWRQKVW